jgi:hypothetical protein
MDVAGSSRPYAGAQPSVPATIPEPCRVDERDPAEVDNGSAGNPLVASTSSPALFMSISPRTVTRFQESAGSSSGSRPISVLATRPTPNERAFRAGGAKLRHNSTEVPVTRRSPGQSRPPPGACTRRGRLFGSVRSQFVADTRSRTPGVAARAGYRASANARWRGPRRILQLPYVQGLSRTVGIRTDRSPPSADGSPTATRPRSA